MSSVSEIKRFRTLLEEGLLLDQTVSDYMNKFRASQEGASPEFLEELRKTETVAGKYFPCPPVVSLSPKTPTLKDRIQTIANAPVSLLSGIWKSVGIVGLSFGFEKMMSLASKALNSDENDPVGISNEGDTCFIAAALQLILKEPLLIQALCEEMLGDSGEFGKFFINYQIADSMSQGPVAGVGALRKAMVLASKNEDFLTGQWDANEVLRSILSDENSTLYGRLQKKGYFIKETVRRYYKVPEGHRPCNEEDLKLNPATELYYSEKITARPPWLEIDLSSTDENLALDALMGRFFKAQIQLDSEPGNYDLFNNEGERVSRCPCPIRFVKSSWNCMPDLIRVNLKRWDPYGHKIETPIQVESLVKLPGITMQLVGFTWHIGSALAGGHWVSFALHNGKYYCFDDHAVTPISEEEFLKQAKNGSDFLLQKV